MLIWMWLIIMVLLEVSVAGIVLANHRRKPRPTVMNEDEYHRFAAILKAWIDFLPTYTKQRALTLAWERELYETQLTSPKQRLKSVKELELGVTFNQKLSKRLLDDFWKTQSGYDKKLDPEHIDQKLWPKEARDYYRRHIKVKEIASVQKLARKVEILKTELDTNTTPSTTANSLPKPRP